MKETAVKDLTEVPVRDLRERLEEVIDEAYPTSQFYHANSVVKADLNELCGRARDRRTVLRLVSYLICRLQREYLASETLEEANQIQGIIMRLNAREDDETINAALDYLTQFEEM